ncbi:MAG: mannose-1-phosphate guanylyltransferase [Bacteroidales bacterium]|nr:mannose-1-phosphate guanylyltransferase [Bacteroidales bacterium]
MNKNHYCIIMAGGVGSRFWPVSRNATPKQFLDLLGVGKSFLQITIERFSKIVPVENIYVVTSERYQQVVSEQAPQILPEHILLEPYRRNTAPCIAYATYKLYKENPDAVVIVSPSDHLIINEEAFVQTISSALDYATNHNQLITIGIQPTGPNTNYGYIQVDKSQEIALNKHQIFQVKTFTEKPNEDLAKVFVETGEFYWNSGMFIWNLQTIKEELETHLPQVTDMFKAAIPFLGTPQEKEYIQHTYEDCPSISIDYGVMEKTKLSWVFLATFGWSDIGTWNSMYEQSKKDENENTIHADVSIISDSQGCVIIEKNQDKLMVVKGLENYIVVDSPDVLMVAPREDAVIKEILISLAVEDKAKYL